MSKVCDVCQKGKVFGKSVSHSNKASNRTWEPNLRKVKALVDGTPKTIKVCSRCLRSGKVQRAL
jgi:large subunit ribosomal protein L28